MGFLFYESIMKIFEFKNNGWIVEKDSLNSKVMLMGAIVGITCDLFILFLLKTKKGFKGFLNFQHKNCC